MKLLFPWALTLSLCLCSGFSLSAQAPSATSEHDSRASVSAYVDRRLSGKDPGASRAIFIAGDFNTGKGWKRNPNLWCADLDLTCFSPWNSTEHNLQGGTLITRRHVLLANHFSNPFTGTPPMVPGATTIEFVGGDNTIYSRTITRFTQVKSTDLLIGTLDSDLPDQITPAFLFPADQRKFVPAGTPLIYTDQEKWACVGECVDGAGPNITLRPATVAGRTAWTTGGPARVGDSGSPVFLPLRGHAVLVCHFFFANGGPSTGYYAAAINAVTGKDYPVREATIARTDDPSAAGKRSLVAYDSDCGAEHRGDLHTFRLTDWLGLP